MGGQRPAPVFPSQPPMTRAAFRACFGVGPEDVGRINFKGRGLTLEMAQLTAVAAIALLFEGDVDGPGAADHQPPVPQPMDRPSADTTSSDHQTGEPTRGALPPNATPGPHISEPGTTGPTAAGAAVVDTAAGTARTIPTRRVVIRQRPPALTITFGSGRAEEPIVIDDGAGRPGELPILIDDDDEGECGPTWRGRSCWSVRDGDDVEPGCSSRYCREDPPNTPPVAAAAGPTDRRAEPAALNTPAEQLIIVNDPVEDVTPSGQPDTPTSPCYCPSGDDRPGCRCSQIKTRTPMYVPSDAEDDDDLGCYLPPDYTPAADIGVGTTDDGQQAEAAVGRNGDPVDVEMCDVALCPPTPGVCAPSASYFDAATPRPGPVLTPLPRFGPDPRDSAVAFEIRYGCRPKDYTVDHGVSRGLSKYDARAVERLAVDLGFGPQASWHPSSSSTSE